MENKFKYGERLEILINAMINDYLTELDFNSEDGIRDAYENLLYKTIIKGEFDDIFLSEELDGLDKSERQRILDLSRKYYQLCFYDGKLDYWQYSVEGVTNGERERAGLLLNNFNYLIRLAKNGGEEVLSFLDKFKSNDLFDDGSIISLLRCKFAADDVLEKVLIEMSKEDGVYNDFNSTQKVILCNYPEGVLYKANDEKIDIVDPKELERHIQKKFIGSYDFDVSNIESISFEETVSIIHSEYNLEKFDAHIR